MKLNSLSRLQLSGQIALERSDALPTRTSTRFVVIADAELRRYFDLALDLTHYAKSCQRVGRCMRLAIISDRQWVGGIVLGSTFPNVSVRDEALGLKPLVRGYASRGLRNAWCKENREYWRALQTIVNHARTFIFPQFQGRGFGKDAHRRLLTEGVHIWEKKYGQRIYAFDTLCDRSDSGLFVANGWSLVGVTKGYTANYKDAFSGEGESVSINNAALKPGKTRWQVWVKVVTPSMKPRKPRLTA
jgi:hypothetical protein